MYHTSKTASKTLFQELMQAGEIPLVREPSDVFVDCNSCATVLQSDENLKRHMPSDHETGLPYNCDKCKFTTHEEVVLKHHTLMKETTVMSVGKFSSTRMIWKNTCQFILPYHSFTAKNVLTEQIAQRIWFPTNLHMDGMV